MGSGLHSNPTAGANFLDVNQDLHTAISDVATESGEHISKTDVVTV